MPNFTPAEIELARELALPREFREGDWYDWLEYPTSPRMSIPALATNGMRADAEYVWLPLEGDCFALLREAGWEYGLEVGSGQHWANAWRDEASQPDGWRPIQTSGATPREALYRLLLAAGVRNHAPSDSM